MPASKRASGRNISEAERNTVRVALRLDPEVADRLRLIATTWRCSLAEVVETAIERLTTER